MKYEILVPKENVIYKDDGKRLILFLINHEDEESSKVYSFFKEFIHTHLLDELLILNYADRNNADIYKEIGEYITNNIGAGPASDLCNILLKSLYVADVKTGRIIFLNGIASPDTIIKWKQSETIAKPYSTKKPIDRKWLYISGAGLVAGIVLGIIITLLPRLIGNTNENSIIDNITQKTSSKYKVNAIYDSKTCTVYFGDTKFEAIEYYIDYQKKVKNTDDINWKLQANIISKNDTLFLKDNCTIYLRGESDKTTSEVQAINVSYYDFITELLATQDPKIKEMLITNSPSPFGNTTFMVDGIPQQVSYYRSSELREYIRRGFKVTELKTLGSNLNPTNKNYPKLTKITIRN